jgi:lipid-binding SYLF domain-containing protein
MKEPQRACVACAAQLSALQSQLVRTNSNAVRGNDIDTSGLRRYFNRPVAFTLGGEVRKAAHTINNMMSGFESLANDGSVQSEYMRGAKGLLFMTVGKVAFGAGLRIGTGLLVVRLPSKATQQQRRASAPAAGGGGGGLGSGLLAAPSPRGRPFEVPAQPWGGDGGRWSAPCAVGLVGLSVGLEAGLETVDMVLPLRDDGVLERFCSGRRHLTLGGEASLSVGLVGRAFNKQNLSSASAPVVGTTTNAYSHSRGLYGGIALQGGVVSVRRDVNTAFYGCECEPVDLFRGLVPPPPNAAVLYEKLDAYESWAGLDHVAQPPSAFDRMENTFHNLGDGEASV